ncbi:MAG: YciI family protein [Steroidobacteraceae bacterium]
MKYVLLIYQGLNPPLPGSDRWNALSKAEQESIYADYAKLTQAPGVTPGLPLGLPNAARTVQVRNGKPEVRNGTYQSEGAGGYAVLEAENMDAAVALAARIPAARYGGAIEVRPAEQYW